MEEKRFYDVHMHLMNLSHLNLLAFLKRWDRFGLTDNKFKLVVTMILLVILFPVVILMLLIYVVKSIVNGETSMMKRFTNLLSFIENDVGSMLLTLEEYMTNPELCELSDSLYNGSSLTIGKNKYDKLVILPLMMDFSYKNITKGNVYSKRPANKPIAEQVVDVFLGIKNYQKKSKHHLIEVHPFMGLNTANYTYDEIKLMLDKYFKDYRGNQLDFLEKQKSLKNFSGNIEKLGSNCFLGIKVYPPLGFNPWPANDKRELEKVKLLYNFCSEKRIPITTHCGKGGYRVIGKEESETLTSPDIWEMVLEAYPNLKLNFAHRADPYNNGEKDWTNKIVELILSYNHVYADFSYRGTQKGFYSKLDNWVNQMDEKHRVKMKNRILFGTDFMINLMNCDSYNAYFDAYSKSILSNEDKDRYGRINVESFLYVL